MDYTPRRVIELFHLLFLAHLRERVAPGLWVLKGGCNLRFYFKSVRYSEDIDLDVHTVAKDTLKTQVSKLLASDAFMRVLRSKKLEISAVTTPKQTDTTQRWKLQVSGPSVAAPVPTKIEFSRRPSVEKPVYEAVDTELIQSYELYPVLCSHYDRASAIHQKVGALIHRAEAQARDVFDLDLLLGAKDASETLLKEFTASELERGIETLVSISYADYKAQVVAYISPEYQAHFGGEEVWSRMQDKVLSFLSTAKERPGA